MKTNTELYDDVMEKLKMTPNLNHNHITIATDNGLVTIVGTVRYFYEKLVAERAIKSIVGVKGVVNDLEVNLPESLKISDTDIAKSAMQALDWDIEIPYDAIQLTVDNGEVKLEGQVEWWYQRLAATKAVRRLKGVRNVINEITIKPRITKEEIKKQIYREFHHHAQIDAEKITVEVNNGKVTLSGKVQNFAERKEAEHAAWSMAGVTQVDNKLHIF